MWRYKASYSGHQYRPVGSGPGSLCSNCILPWPADRWASESLCRNCFLSSNRWKPIELPTARSGMKLTIQNSNELIFFIDQLLSIYTCLRNHSRRKPFRRGCLKEVVRSVHGHTMISVIGHLWEGSRMTNHKFQHNFLQFCIYLCR
jgi:hypothetical protein